MRLSIKGKLISGFALILIITIIVGWRGIVTMHDINETLTIINTGEFIPAKMIANANRDHFKAGAERHLTWFLACSVPQRSLLHESYQDTNDEMYLIPRFEMVSYRGVYVRALKLRRN